MDTARVPARASKSAVAGEARTHTALGITEPARPGPPSSGTAALEGIVETTRGVPLAGVGMALSRQIVPGPNAPAQSRMRATRTTGPRGRFRITGLVRGQAYEIKPNMPGVAPLIVVPPQAVCIRLDPPCLLELERAREAELGLLWAASSLEPPPWAGVLSHAPSYQRTNGSWPPELDVLTIPIWPGRTRVRLRLRHGGHRRLVAKTIVLPEHGGHRHVVVRLGAGLPVLQVHNPHPYPAAIYRWPADARDYSIRTLVDPGRNLALPVPAGDCRFASAVYPKAVVTWTVHAVAQVTTDVDIPSGLHAPGVFFRASHEGRTPQSTQLILSPSHSITDWHVAYTETRPWLFAHSLWLGSAKTLVVPSRGGLRYEVDAPGFTRAKGRWPADGRLDVRMKRHSDQPPRAK